MAKQKEELDEPKEQKNEKAQAVALFNSMPDDLKTAIDEFVKNFKKTGDFAKKIIELAEKHGMTKQQIEIVVKAKMASLGLKAPNLRSLLEIKKESVPSGEVEEAAEEAAETETANLPAIVIPLTGENGVNKNDLINGLKKASQSIKVFFDASDNSFVSMEFN